ncbi:hypothetical protein [Azospirillum argentinense]|uniref:hypothetical protein n=1 Tax=Azospirillum argentinense TaxID=2970906 RepID=UPI0011AF3285|nr:hypothetical protein [Azospirillum argentinense]
MTENNLTNKKFWVVSTLPRSGTHFLQAILSSVPGSVVVQEFFNGSLAVMGNEWINKGLYEKLDHPVNAVGETQARFIFLFRHPHHPPVEDSRFSDARTIDLIGYPFDRYISGGIVENSDEYAAIPSSKRDYGKDYFLKSDSIDCAKAMSVMDTESDWMNSLIGNKNTLILRYEDFFNAPNIILECLSKELGEDVILTHQARKNNSRAYWQERPTARMDDGAFFKIFDSFSHSLEYFYPEKWPTLCQLRKG